jgi:hypothetical protein
MEFKKKIELRVKYNILLTAISLFGLVCAFLQPMLVRSLTTNVISNFYIVACSPLIIICLSLGLFVFGLLNVIKNRKLLIDEKALKEKEIEANDERNKIIELKTWAYTSYTLIIGLFFGIIIASIFSEIVMFTLLGVLIATLISLVIINILVKKMM